MLAKLFALYPVAATEDAEMKIAAYREELRDVPALLLSHTLKRLTSKPREFVPDVGAIRYEAALFLRERHRLATGQDPHAPILGGELNVERWLQRARDPLPELAASAEERATPEQRAQGSALLDSLVKSKTLR